MAALTDGLGAEIAGRDYNTLRATRDEKLLAVLRALRPDQGAAVPAPV